MSGVPPVRALIVDDSAVVRQVLGAVLARDPGIEVIGAVADPVFAMHHMNREWPDVVVLDIEMPRMDGLTFLRKVMAVRPTPVVVCSTLTAKGAETTVEALSAGAVGIVCKPTTGLRSFLEEEAADLVRAVKDAAAGNMHRHAAAAQALRGRPAVPAPRPRAALTRTTDRIVALGTSTGGTQALEVVLSALPADVPGMVVVQHMPERFTAAFAARLDSVCACEVAEASDGERVLPGRALIAPGGRHLSVERDGAHYRVRVADGPRVNRHKPSVDVLFRSVAREAGRNALGVIMTGMGDDGARGLLAMREAGAATLGQDEHTCVVYGMPHAAAVLGAVEHELPLDALAARIEAFGALEGAPSAAGQVR
ncbi:MAG: chemotaxis response regulator protein-glutamate methylesterase [Kineosporiaceae bacterium]